jgi:phage FluMu protein Com
MDFDILSLLRFGPPEYFCTECNALLYDFARADEGIKCPVCKSIFKISTNPLSHCTLEFDNLLEHGKQLARIALFFEAMEEFPDIYPPMHILFMAIDAAEKFIHFTTFGLSHIILGALKLKAQTIPVRGIVSNVPSDFVKELEPSHENPYLHVKIFEQGTDHYLQIPHQKMIVIDGMMAFKGAANLTISGWRKVATGHDYIEVVTNFKEVVELNNKLFSPIWYKTK